MKKPLQPRKILLLAFLGAAAFLIALFAWIGADLPSIERESMRFFPAGVRITDRSGSLLYEVLPGGEGRHSPVTMDVIPEHLIQATLATEDRYFYENPGFDALGILRAAWINIRGGETIAGGSTITQQVVRNLLLAPEESRQQTLRRKLREAYLAWMLTRTYTKQEILAIYLNQTYYGEMAYGVEAAARTFFGRPVSSLDLAEAALLAGLPQAPALYDPLVHPVEARQRQSVVLRLMEEQGTISASQRSRAEREPLVFNPAPYPMQAPHYVLMVLNRYDSLAAKCDFSAARGVIIRTGLDLNAQRNAENAIRKQINALRANPQKDMPGEGAVDHNVTNAALVAMDARSGDVLALVGSADYADTAIQGAVNMAVTPRQPGSTLKPFIYAAAFDPVRDHHGQPPWTAATMILDVRTNFVTHDGHPYTPANYDNREHGPVLARNALASSLNIPAVKTLQFIGLDSLFEELSAWGITTLGNPDKYDLSLALGGGDVSLLDLTSAYAAFANGGWKVTPELILDVSSADGTLLYSSQAAGNGPSEFCAPPRAGGKRVVDERVAWLVTDILADDEARFLGFGRNSALKLDRPAAVKTGTTSNFHDNWTVGYTPDLVAGVWVGNTNNQPMRGMSGLTGAGPIWHAFMRETLKNRPQKQFVRPAGLERAEVCALSGLLPTPDCPYRTFEWFLPGTVPAIPDTVYRRVVVDMGTGRLADDSTPPSQRVDRTVLDLPASAAAWARQEGLTLYADLQRAQATHPPDQQRAGDDGPALSILSPRPNAVFLLAPDRTELQRLPIQASLGGNIPAAMQPAEVTIQIDAEDYPAPAPDYRIWWPLKTGDHTLLARARFADGSSTVSEDVHFQVHP